MLGRLSPEDEATPKRKRQLAWVRRLPLLVALAIIVLCTGVILNLSSNVKVVSITNSDNPSNKLFLRDTSTYQHAAQQLFASSVLNHNKLTADASGIAAQLETEFPELQNVSITLPIIGHRPVVYVQPANPALFLTTQGGGAYILDKSGRALVSGSEAVQHMSRLHIPTVQDQSGLHVDVGRVALPSRDVNFIAQIAAQLQAQNLQIESLQLPPASSELHVKLRGVSYVVRFNTQGDPRVQAGAFLAAKQQLEGQHGSPSQYFDVRVPERVYFR